MNTSTLTSKGQITIPKGDILSLKGIVRTRRRRAVTVREMNEAIAEGFSRL